MINKQSLNTDLFSTIQNSEDFSSNPVSPKGFEPASPKGLQNKKMILPASRYEKKGDNITSSREYIKNNKSSRNIDLNLDIGPV